MKSKKWYLLVVVMLMGALLLATCGNESYETLESNTIEVVQDTVPENTPASGDPLILDLVSESTQTPAVPQPPTETPIPTNTPEPTANPFERNYQNQLVIEAKGNSGFTCDTLTNEWEEISVPFQIHYGNGRFGITVADSISYIVAYLKNPYGDDINAVFDIPQGGLIEIYSGHELNKPPDQKVQLVNCESGWHLKVDWIGNPV